MGEHAQNEARHFVDGAINLLGGVFRPDIYASVLLPLLALQRAGSVRHRAGGTGVDSLETVTSSSNPSGQLLEAVASLPSSINEAFRWLQFEDHAHRLASAGLLSPVCSLTASLDLDPSVWTNRQMDTLFDSLLERVAIDSSGHGGEHATPRDVALLVEAVMFGDACETASSDSRPATVYDPAMGSGGFLVASTDSRRSGRHQVFGQDISQHAVAWARLRTFLSGVDPSGLVPGNTLTEDAFPSRTFDFVVSGPPMGMSWAQFREPIEAEHHEHGFDGRFGPGLPPPSDSSLLFLMHMLSKLRQPSADSPRGGRLVMLCSAGPLFRGHAAGGEAAVRRHLVEHDLIESVIALPEQLHFSSAIPTYLLVINTSKRQDDLGRVRFVDGRRLGEHLRRPIGSKRQRLSTADVDALASAAHGETSSLARVIAVEQLETSAGTSYRIEPWMFMAKVSDETHGPLSAFAQSTDRVRPPYDDARELLEVDDDGGIVLGPLTNSARPEPRILYECRGGDLVQRAGRWYVLEDSTPESLARLPALRMKAAYESQKQLLALWLSTDEARLQGTGRSWNTRPPLDARVAHRWMKDTALASAIDRLAKADRNAQAALTRTLTPLWIVSAQTYQDSTSMTCWSTQTASMP